MLRFQYSDHISRNRLPDLCTTQWITLKTFCFGNQTSLTWVLLLLCLQGSAVVVTAQCFVEWKCWIGTAPFLGTVRCAASPAAREIQASTATQATQATQATSTLAAQICRPPTAGQRKLGQFSLCDSMCNFLCFWFEEDRVQYKTLTFLVFVA